MFTARLIGCVVECAGNSATSKGDVMAKKPKFDFEDFENALRASYETGHSDPKLRKDAIELAKYVGVKLSIKPGKK